MDAWSTSPGNTSMDTRITVPGVTRMDKWITVPGVTRLGTWISFPVISVLSTAVIVLTVMIPGCSSASIKAEMHVPRGSRVSMFDLYNMNGVECSISGSGMFRSKDVDIKRAPVCPHQVWIFFYNAGAWKYELRIDPSSESTNLRSWMKEKPSHYFPRDFLGNVSLDTGEQDFDFLLYDDTDNNIRAAVYNKRDDVTRPRFFYSRNALSRSVLQDSLTNTGTGTTFEEADMMRIRLVFDDTCEPVQTPRYYNTCTEALDTEFCPCDCAYYDKMMYWEVNALPEDMTDDEKKETVRPEMEATKKQLTVNKTDLSSFRNKKISASDSRTSAKGLGMLGAIMLGFVFGSLVLCDLLSIKTHANNVKGKCSCCKR
ncbi:uncharacterized protein LOC117342671 isoform X2 [Pecten maximus]|uniref:uncharacterized protein LOC117342671 isoform X1 n=1 Tax=Pecten maximus TaxID=6579 RepID=UPI001458D425|nr:uncharacterized protein LOC117342671 isoform X1 [Pecten maximus]XP_033760762.1 uncharacterized protein LOC117342671 isoform X2 [Pecten maximus]